MLVLVDDVDLGVGAIAEDADLEGLGHARDEHHFVGDRLDVAPEDTGRNRVLPARRVVLDRDVEGRGRLHPREEREVLALGREHDAVGRTPLELGGHHIVRLIRDVHLVDVIDLRTLRELEHHIREVRTTSDAARCVRGGCPHRERSGDERHRTPRAKDARPATRVTRGR